MGKVTVQHDWSSQNWLAPGGPFTESLTDSASASDAVAKFVGAVSPVTVSLSDTVSAADAVTASITGGGGASADFTEDFSTYTSTTDFLNDPNGYYDEAEDNNTGQMALDTGVGYDTLTQSVRYDFPDQAGNCASEPTISRLVDFSAPAVFGADQTEFWGEIQIRFQGPGVGQEAFDTAWPNKGRARVNNVVGTFQEGENIDVAGEAGDPVLKRVDDIGNGELVLWWADVQDPAQGATITGLTSGATADCVDASWGCTQNADYKFIFGTLVEQDKHRMAFNTGSTFNRLLLIEGADCDSCSSPWCTENITGKQDTDAPQCVINTLPLAGGDWSATNLFDGTFHEFRWHWKLADPLGNNDGVIECWIDGTKFAEVFDLKTDASAMNGLALGRNKSRGRAMSLWWGQIKMWLSDPGWT